MQLSGTHRGNRSDDRGLYKEHERDFWLHHAENSIEPGHVVSYDNHIHFERITKQVIYTNSFHEVLEINLQWKFSRKGGYQLDPFGKIISQTECPNSPQSAGFSALPGSPIPPFDFIWPFYRSIME
jgi:hypothetical protein